MLIKVLGDQDFNPPTFADVQTSTAKLIGYQILTALGIGFTIQNVIIAAQAEVLHCSQLYVIWLANSTLTFLSTFSGRIRKN